MPFYKGVQYYNLNGEVATSVGVCRRWSDVDRQVIRAHDRAIRDAEDQALSTQFGQPVATIKAWRRSMNKVNAPLPYGHSVSVNMRLKGCSCKWNGGA